MFELLLDSVAPVLVIMKNEPPNKAFVEYDEQGQVLKSRPNLEAMVFLIMKGEVAVFLESPF